MASLIRDLIYCIRLRLRFPNLALLLYIHLYNPSFHVDKIVDFKEYQLHKVLVDICYGKNNIKLSKY